MFSKKNSPPMEEGVPYFKKKYGSYLTLNAPNIAGDLIAWTFTAG